MNFLIKQYINTLCEAAKANQPVDDYAAKLIVDFGEDNVADYLEKGNLVEQLANYEPNVHQYHSWFMLLNEKLESLVFEDNQEVVEDVAEVTAQAEHEGHQPSGRSVDA